MDVREKQSSENRLIDREALLSFEKMDAELCATCGEHHTAEDVIMMIKTAPTVDAVPVVRCKDCKYCDISLVLPTGREMYTCMEGSHDHQMLLNPTDYCSYGVRKGEDNDD